MDTQNYDGGSESSNVRTRIISFLHEDGSVLNRAQRYFKTEEGKRVGIVTAVAVVLLAVVWIAAAISLPGQLLYGLKTNVLESAGGVFSFTTESKARYNLDLMRERLDEAERLAAHESIDPGAVAAFSNRINENGTAFALLTKGSEERTLDREVVINLTNDFASVTSAIEEVTEENETLLPVADTVGDVRRDALRRLDDEIEVYVSLVGDDELRNFITRELQRISDRLSHGDLSEDTTDRVGRSLADVSEAIVANNANDAVEAIFEAKRLITAEEYLGRRE